MLTSQIILKRQVYRKSAIKGSILSVLNKAFDIAPEILIGVAVDVVVKQDHSLLSSLGPVKTQVLVLGAACLLVWVLESLTEYLFNLEWRRLAQRIQHDLRIEAYAHIQKMEPGYFDSRSAGGLASVLNDDINQLERFLDGGANAILQTITSVLLIGSVFVFVQPLLALLAMVPIPVIIWGAFAYRRISQTRYSKVRQEAGRLGGKLASNLAGIFTIQSQVAESHELAKMTETSLSYVRANDEAIQVSSAFVPLIRMAVLAGFLSTLVVGGFMATDGRIEIASYSMLVFLTQRLLWPFTRLAETVDLYQRASASAGRVLEILKSPLRQSPGRIPMNAHTTRGELEFRGLTFGYPDRPLLFQNLSLRVPAGTSAAIVGHTGSGKSSLAKLLMGFYFPLGGDVRIDEHTTLEWDLQDLRKCVGYVGQDVHLFEGTLRDNLKFGNFEASDDQMIEAATQAEAHAFIVQLPHGYDTWIGERGAQLSGGQRQRIAIARAILKDPPVLIFDEATSAVDTETERAIQRSIQRLVKGRTSLFIAHRLSTVKAVDRIHVLHEGRITESGTHSELVGAEGLYRQLWSEMI